MKDTLVPALMSMPDSLHLIAAFTSHKNGIVCRVGKSIIQMLLQGHGASSDNRQSSAL